MRKKDIPFERPVSFKFVDIPIGILFTIAFIAIGLALAINLRPLYYLNISWQNLEYESGLNSVVIKENYNALIDYCSPFNFGELKFPSLRASQEGLSHFAEVKTIFNVIYISGAVSLILCILAVLYKRSRREYNYLFVSGVTALVLPVILCIASAINFDAFFKLFHKLAFNNDNWLFDPETDPIILLLPESYFMQCALIIAFTVIMGSIILIIRYRIYKKRKKDVRLMPSRKNYIY